MDDCLDPRDLTCASAVNRRLNQKITTSPLLWRKIFLDQQSSTPLNTPPGTDLLQEYYNRAIGTPTFSRGADGYGIQIADQSTRGAPKVHHYVERESKGSDFIGRMSIIGLQASSTPFDLMWGTDKEAL